MGHHRAYHLGIHRRRGRARRRDAHRVRGRRREAVDLLLSGSGAAGVRCPPVGAEKEVRRRRAEIRIDPVHLFLPVGTGDPEIRRSCISRRGDLPQHPRRKGLSAARSAARCGSKPDRPLGAFGRRREAGHRGLARAVRWRAADERRGQTVETHPERDQAARRRRHHDRTPRQSPPPHLWRRAGAGAPPRQPVRRRHPGAEARRAFPWPAPTG